MSAGPAVRERWGRRRVVRRAARLGAGIAAMLLLSGCMASAGPDVENTGPESASPLPGVVGPHNPTGTPAPAQETELVAPAGFDASRGWSANQTDRVFAVSPAAGVTVDLYAADLEDGNLPVVIARRITDGTVAWTSTPLKVLDTDDLPTVRIVDAGQGLYAVVVRVGTLPADGVSRARQLVVADSFRLVGDGPDKAPAQHLEHVVEDAADVGIAVGDGGVLITPPRPRTEEPPPTTVWDPMTGATADVPYSAEHPAAGCPADSWTCMVRDTPRAATAVGPLFVEQASSSGGFAFGIMGRWRSPQVAPPNRGQGTVVGLSRTVVVAMWRTDENSPPLYAAHDLATGAVLASAECAAGTEATKVLTDELDLSAETHVSPQGRYLVSGPFAVDLSGRKAVCVAGNADARGVYLTAVDDKGTAYGRLLDDDDETKDFAVVHTATGKVDALPEKVLAPSAVTGNGTGIFAVEDLVDSSEGPFLVVCPPGTAPASASPAAGASPSPNP
ncbi:hypothetical protein [Streptodolium elevatio]